MKKILFTLLFCSLFFQANRSIAAITCPKAPTPKLSFAMKKTATKFNFSKSIKQLTKENLVKLPQSGGWVNEGIMSTKFPNYKISATVNGVVFPGIGKACYWVDEIKFFWLLSPTIFIAKDYKKGSCKYKTIIGHERKHVEIDIATLTKYKKYIKGNLQKQSSKSITTGLVNADSKINLLGTIEKKLKPVVDTMVRERTRLQGNIDTVEEYKKLGAKCR